MIRPRPARWFEALAARDDATIALEALAATGAVELEARPSAGMPQALADVRPLLAQYADLARGYRAYWPKRGLAPSSFPDAPAALLERDLARLRGWRDDAEPVIAELQALDAERSELALWRDALAGADAAALPLDRLVADGKLRRARLLVLPGGAPLPTARPRTLVRPMAADGRTLALVVGDGAEVDALAHDAVAADGRVHALPGWLQRGRDENLAFIARRHAELADREQALRNAIDELARRHGLHAALGDAERLDWLLANVRALETTPHFCFITGWTSVDDPGELAAALERSGARALVHLAPPPEGARAPLLFANPWWARPFEVFTRALGTPAGDEVDPSMLLAVMVPLLFGYMFGDVGQGLVIAAAGFALRRRFALARIFVAGGLSAAVFGFAFGSVFSLHLVPALWVAPLERPLDILAAPIVFGALLLATGLLLGGIEASWRGMLSRWLATDAMLIAVYAGLLAAFADTRWLALAAAAGIAFAVGHAAVAHRATAGLAALVNLVERTLQLLVNTLSFARVGAFALAHAGLSSAIVALMAAADSILTKALVLVVGNVVVIALEALVVSIQTTRLVLFEFFTKFLEAGGRAFRPLPLPPSTSTGSAG